MKKTTIFFDLEAWYEVPYRQQFNIERTILRIKKILDKYKIKAVFNVLGKVAEQNPKLIAKLHKEGHEIASHGYTHENFIHLTPEELNKTLEKTEKILEKITKEKVLGLRPPWLYCSDDVYKIAEKRNYKWISNVYTPLITKIYRPDLKSNFFYNKLRTYLLKYKKAKYIKEPFKINNLLQIPLLSLMDGDLLGVMNTNQKTRKLWLEYAFRSLKEQYHNSKDYFNLNFHPWIIGTENRIELLDNILKYISQQKNNKFVLAKGLL